MTFWKKYYNVISVTSFSSTLFNIQKGVESLDTLVTFFSENFDGSKNWKSQLLLYIN
jgi:hypothetical protein